LFYYVQADDRAKSLRESVDIKKLSKIALYNLEKEGDAGSDYTAAEAQAGGIHIESADAELDFEEQRDDGEITEGIR
jgi:serine/threonine-protein kinase ULK4